MTVRKIRHLGCMATIHKLQHHTSSHSTSALINMLTQQGLLEKLTVIQLVKKFLVFIKLEGS
jgi:hypothetical protein